MCPMLTKLALVPALLLALAGCDLAGTARDVQQVTVGDAVTAAGQVHEQRRNWRQKAQEARVAWLDACLDEANDTQVQSGWAAAQPIFDACMTFAKGNMPELLVVSLSKELKEAYAHLSDDQIQALGLPPRGDLPEDLPADGPGPSAPPPGG